jgi:hypothetical protein
VEKLPTVTEEPVLQTEPRILRGFDFGILAAFAVALVYGFLTDPIGLTWGLVAVGVVGGMAIGGAVSKGAWDGQPHLTVRKLQVVAVLIAIAAGIVGLFVAYVGSQAFYQQAATPLLQRLSIGGFSDYFAAVVDAIRFDHAAAVAAMAFMAWRGAR